MTHSRCDTLVFPDVQGLIPDNKEYNNFKLLYYLLVVIIIKPITNPINPEASTKENPIKAYLVASAAMEGLRDTEYTNDANIVPTPIATPVKHITPNAAAILPILITNILRITPTHKGVILYVGYPKGMDTKNY